jgi:hypothetical protein
MLWSMLTGCWAWRRQWEDEVFEQLVLARIIEPVNKADSLRVPEDAEGGGRACQMVCVHDPLTR